DERGVLGMFMAQWFGLVCASAELDLTGTTRVLGLGRESAVELVTAVVGGLVLGLTLRSLEAFQGRIGQPRRSHVRQQALRITHHVSRITFHASRFTPPDYLLPGAVVLLGGA